MNTLVPSIGPSGGRETVSDMFTLGDWGKLLKRRQKIIYICLAVFLALATIRAITATRLYQATGEIQVQKESSGDFGLGNGVLTESGTGGDPLDYNLTLQTQAQILKSDTIALQVIKDMNLENTDFYKKKEGASSFTLFPSWLFFWRKPAEPLSVSIDNAPNRRATSVKIFESRLKITPVSGTRLIDVAYLAPSPSMAADVVNRVIAAFTRYTFDSRFAATQQGSAWLGTQLSQLKKDAEDAQAKAITLQRETGMFGQDDQHNIVLSRLQTLNDNLTSATSNRILKQAIYEAAKNGDPELISNLGGNTTANSGPNAAFNLLQNLRSQEAQIKSQIAQDKVKYGENFPKLMAEKSQLQNIESAIQAEVNRIAGRARSDYEIAARTENQDRGVFESQKQLANELNDKAIAYSLAKQEADESRNLYESLVSKLKQTGVLEGLKSSNISIVRSAVLPPPDSPKKPNIPLYYAAAIVGGLFFGVVGAIAVDLSDNTFHSLAEIEQFLGLPMLGILPNFNLKSGSKKVLGSGRKADRGGLALKDAGTFTSELEIQAASKPDSAFVESLRALRTSLLLTRSGTAPQVILVTSSLAGEGKSTLSLNLAGVFAQQGGRVLLVDADLRTSTLQRRLGVNEKQGLSGALASETGLPAPRKLDQFPNLSVLFGGAVPPFPSELLGSKRMRELISKWRNEYDFIFIDSPPVLPVTDAIVLSQVADATLLVVRHAVTQKQAVQRSFRSLSRQMPSDAILGVVLNAVAKDAAEDYGYYGYHAYEYSSKGTGTYGASL